MLNYFIFDEIQINCFESICLLLTVWVIGIISLFNTSRKEIFLNIFVVRIQILILSNQKNKYDNK